MLKVSNSSEDPAVLDMEAAAALHVTAVDPGLRVALPWRPAATGDAGPARAGDDPARLRAEWREGERAHWVRLYDVLPGTAASPPAAVRRRARRLGETTARLAQALRGFAHARAHGTMVWDVRHGLAARDMLGDIREPHARAVVARVLDAFERRVAPVWPRLGAQVANTDLTVDNALTDEPHFVTGIVDLGDMSDTALTADCSTPSEPISSWRAAQGLEDREFAERYNLACVRMLGTMTAAGWDELARQLGAPRALRPDASLTGRRAGAFGPAIDPLFYDEPVEGARRGRVDHGRGRPDVPGRVQQGAVRRARPSPRGRRDRAAEPPHQHHTRYLHPAAIELAERLAATCPPGLDTVILVNSGSEANDVAWRIATAVTGRGGGLCTAFAYHGITGPGGRRPPRSSTA